MDKTFSKGEHVEVETVHGEVFQGRLYSQNTDKTKLSLYNVRQMPKHDILEGLTHFFKPEIKYIKRVKSFETLDELPSAVMIPLEECKALSFVSKKFIFINQIDNTFHEAIGDLNEYSFIAMGIEGADMGRKCRLPILTLSTPLQIYIFDIQVMQDNAFDGGIRSLLESTHVKKIIHNCRKLSDCLLHKHNVELKNVFDTQVADIIIHKNTHDTLPTTVKTLQECLSRYLGLPEKTVTEKVDIVEWSKRPVSLDVKEIASKNVLYLHRLSEVIHEKMYAPFNEGVKFYLDYHRMTNDFDAWYRSSQDKQLPKSFQSVVGHKEG